MLNLFKAFIFKLRKDLTFRITLFIGLGIAILMTLIYLAIDLGMKALSDDPSAYKFMFCTGQSLFVSSLSPAQNFGIAIPINLISFTVLEFSQGTIRNKIITGNSKVKIYLSLVLSGLIFTFALIISYSLLCLALGSIVGGFDVNGAILGVTSGTINGEFLLRLIILSILAYILITVFSIFFATLLRNIGPCIPIVIILLVGLYMVSSVVGSLKGITGEGGSLAKFNDVLEIVSPFHSLSAFSQNEEMALKIENKAFISQIINNVIYTSIFLFFGTLIFAKRDVK